MFEIIFCVFFIVFCVIAYNRRQNKATAESVAASDNDSDGDLANDVSEQADVSKTNYDELLANATKDLQNKKYSAVIKLCKKQIGDVTSSAVLDDKERAQYLSKFQELEQRADFAIQQDKLIGDIKQLHLSVQTSGRDKKINELSSRFSELSKLKKSYYDNLTVDTVVEYNKLFLSVMALQKTPDAKQAGKVIEEIMPLSKTEAVKAKKTKQARAAQEAAKDFDTRLVNTDVDLEKLADKLSASDIREFSLCLYGAPGTGKSAYAKYLAKRMGIDIIIKRASDLKNKYVGESEKAIAAAFAEAHKANAMLVFDEADSFLRDRSMAHGSWEVSEVNEMLTQMESAKIPFVCTTNLLSTIDRAALRRFVFKVKYSFMTEPQVKIAFERFFGKPVKKSVKHLTKLSPGDFSVVQKKAKVLKVTDESELIEMLEQEMAAKDE